MTAAHGILFRHTRLVIVATAAFALSCDAALASAAAAQSPAPGLAQAPQPSQTQGAQASGGASSRVAMDRIVAVVNDDLILESDVDAEERFAAFTPLRPDATESRDKLIERLVDRNLILQQIKQQPQAPITDAQVDAEIATLQKNIPQCATYHCDTASGWERFCADLGFSVNEVRERWRTRMQVLGFIEQRFRMGIRITQTEIDAYYKNKLLPAYQKDKVPPPSEASIADRIQEILLQQQVTALLEDWLKTLRAQGSVRMLDGGKPSGSVQRSGEAPL
jgi:peptidyl-prolyl cis-trans isomerase SurA